MSTKSKYQSVLNLGETLGIANGSVEESHGILKVKGTAKTQYEKNLLWDEIKRIGGEQPRDIEADIRVSDDTVFHRHTVASGDTLGKIAKQYYGQPMQYHAIFNANTHILDNPDVIHPGQELIIPHLK